jgi:hypothetical protein
MTRRPGTSLQVITLATPGMFRASSTSIRSIRARGQGERSTAPWSIPGSFMSSAKRARPSTLSEASTRGIRSPIFQGRSRSFGSSPSRKVSAAFSTASSILA